MNTIHLGIDELLKHEDIAQGELLQEMKAASELAVDTLNDLICQEGFDENWLSLDIMEENAYDMLTNLIHQSQRHVRYHYYSSVITICRPFKGGSYWKSLMKIV